jgi:hypothetical protein
MSEIRRMKTGCEIPARYEALHTAFGAAGEPPEEHSSRADVETGIEDDEVALQILFDEVDQTGNYKQTVALYLDAKATRALAYELLLLANDLE